MPVDVQAQWRARYDRGLAGERFSVEHAYELPDGTHHFLAFFNPIVTDGVVTGLANFSTEVTERKRAEEAARQHQAELTHVLRLSTMGEMAAGLAHEINQPLAAIVNYAQGCSRRLRGNRSEVDAVLPVIDDIAAEALRAGEIIRRLRSLVRKETPRQDWIDLADIAGEILRLVQPDTIQHGVAVYLDAEPDLPHVHGDRIQIEQVVLNLLRNAIDAMLEATGRRELHVRIGRVGDGAVELAVRDTGHGMAPPVAERVFDPFFSTKPGGLGMGLSISRTIIEVHQGQLSVTLNPDSGVTFHVTLPVPAAAPSIAVAAG
jgi:C4-dicarboxylate-specific signal transduction histidine kinase